MKTEKRNKITALLVVVGLFVLALPASVSARDLELSFTATTSSENSKDTIQVRSVKYDNDDNKYDTANMEVKFAASVQWKTSAKIVSIEDNNGETYDGWLEDREKKECDIAINNLKEGCTYTIKINGIKNKNRGKYQTLTLKVKVPASDTASSKVEILKVTVDDRDNDYDNHKIEIDIKFKSRVQWKSNAEVSSIVDSQGESYSGILADKDHDGCEVYIQDVKYGEIYTIEVSGVKAKGAASYETITIKDIEIPERSDTLRVKKVEYEEDDDYDEAPYKVEFSFNKRIVTKSSSCIIIKDSSGKSYSNKDSYVKWDDDDCELYLFKPLKYGEDYTYEIRNIKTAGGKYATLKGSFTAR